MEEEKSVAQAVKETTIMNLLNDHAVNNEAAKDCFNSLKFESYGDKVFVRNANGEILLDQDILKYISSTRPGYLKSDQQKKEIDNLANELNEAHQQEKDDLQQKVVDAAQSGDFELFKKLRQKQGATYR